MRELVPSDVSEMLRLSLRVAKSSLLSRVLMGHVLLEDELQQLRERAACEEVSEGVGPGVPVGLMADDASETEVGCGTEEDETPLVAQLRLGRMRARDWSPRTKRACAIEGLVAAELSFKPFEAFRAATLSDADARVVARRQMQRFEVYEASRLAKIRDVLNRRNALQAEIDSSTHGVHADASVHVGAETADAGADGDADADDVDAGAGAVANADTGADADADADADDDLNDSIAAVSEMSGALDADSLGSEAGAKGQAPNNAVLDAFTQQRLQQLERFEEKRKRAQAHLERETRRRQELESKQLLKDAEREKCIQQQRTEERSALHARNELLKQTHTARLHARVEARRQQSAQKAATLTARESAAAARAEAIERRSRCQRAAHEQARQQRFLEQYEYEQAKMRESRRAEEMRNELKERRAEYSLERRFDTQAELLKLVERATNGYALAFDEMAALRSAAARERHEMRVGLAQARLDGAENARQRKVIEARHAALEGAERRVQDERQRQLTKRGLRQTQREQQRQEARERMAQEEAAMAAQRAVVEEARIRSYERAKVAQEVVRGDEAEQRRLKQEIAQDRIRRLRAIEEQRRLERLEQQQQEDARRAETLKLEASLRQASRLMNERVAGEREGRAQPLRPLTVEAQPGPCRYPIGKLEFKTFGSEGPKFTMQRRPPASAPQELSPGPVTARRGIDGALSKFARSPNWSVSTSPQRPKLSAQFPLGAESPGPLASATTASHIEATRRSTARGVAFGPQSPQKNGLRQSASLPSIMSTTHPARSPGPGSYRWPKSPTALVDTADDATRRRSAFSYSFSTAERFPFM